MLSFLFIQKIMITKTKTHTENCKSSHNTWLNIVVTKKVNGRLTPRFGPLCNSNKYKFIKHLVLLLISSLFYYVK